MATFRYIEAIITEKNENSIQLEHFFSICRILISNIKTVNCLDIRYNMKNHAIL